MSNQAKDKWAEAKRLCRLNEDDIRMAKALGFQPKSLIKNIPARTQRWKAPVKDWVRSLYAQRFGTQPLPPAPTAKRAPVVELVSRDYPWPDKPRISQPVQRMEGDEFEFIFDGFWNSQGAPDEEDVEEENALMLRRQRLFRWAAQWIAISMSKLPEVQKVVAFGAVAQPLQMEVPRFSRFRRHRIEVYHEGADLDLAVFTTDSGKLQSLKKALNVGLQAVRNTAYGGVAHHQVDVHVFEDPGAYKGRLCIFGQCPKEGKVECLVPGCGVEPFLRRFEKYRFNAGQFEGETKVILFDRATGFVARPPEMDAEPRTRQYRVEIGDGISDEDVPF